MIREATERLADMMERMSEVIGDLNSVSEEMREVEGELQRGNLNQQVLNKQREILTRLPRKFQIVAEARGQQETKG